MAVVKVVNVRIDVDRKDIKSTGKDFDKLNSQAKKTEGTMGNLSKSIIKVGAALVGAFAVKAVITDAINTITQFDQAIADLGAITGSTGAELLKFQKEVLKVSAATGKGASEIAKAFQIVGSAQPELLKSAAALGEVTRQAVLLAQAGGLEVPEAADALTKSMNQFGASAADAARFTDILATSQQKGTSTIVQLSEALKNVGAVANAAGLTFEETNVALQALAKGGLVGAEAGTGLRGVLARLSDQANDDINPSLTSLTEVIENLSKKNLGLKEASELVGLENAKSLLTLISQKDVINDLTGALNEQGNAARQAAQRMETVRGKTEILSSAYERFVLTLNDGDGAISKAIGGLLDLGTSILSTLSGTNNLVSEFSALKKETEQLEKNLNPLLDRYDELAAKSELSADEQKELDKIIRDVSRDVPLAVRGIDEYGKALGISTKAARGFISAQRELLQLKNKEAIDANTEAFTEQRKELASLALHYRQATDGTIEFNLKIGEGKDAIFKWIEAGGEQIQEYQKQLILINSNKRALTLQRDELLGGTLAKQLDTEAIDENTESTDSNTKSKLTNAQALIKLQADAKKLVDEELKASRILNDKEEEEEDDPDFLKLVGLDEDGIKKLDEGILKEKELLDQRDADKLEGQLQFNETTAEFEQALADKKASINEGVLFNAIGLAAALAAAATDSVELQKAALIFEKLVAVANIVVNTAKSNAITIGEGAALSIPTSGASAGIAAGIVAANNISSGLAIATVLATSIPQFKAINAKRLKDGEVLIDGAGTETSDSIPAMLSKNESIINAKSSKKHTSALKAINDDRFDEYLNRVVMQRMYTGKREGKPVVLQDKKVNIKIPDSYRMMNPSSVSKPIVDAIEKSNFLNQNSRWA